MSGRVVSATLTAVFAFFALASMARATPGDDPQDLPVPTIRAAAAKSFTLPARVTQQHISIQRPAAIPIAMFDTRLDARMGKAMKSTMGSLYGLIPSGILLVLVLVRTLGEDATLKAELPGYAEYASKVRYRWLPGVF